MASEPPNQAVELLIQKLLKSSKSVDEVSEQLLQNFRDRNPTREALESIAVFLLYAGQPATLNELFAKGAREGWQLPWALFCESLFLSSAAVPAIVKTCLLAGAKSQDQLEDLARSNMLDHFDESLKKMRLGRADFLHEKLMQERESLLGKAEMMRAQGMLEQEGEILERLTRLFPNDEELRDLRKVRQVRQRLATLAKPGVERERWVPLAQYEVIDDETAAMRRAIESSMQEWLEQNGESLPDQGSEMAEDFAIAQLMLENHAAALALLPKSPTNASVFWLRLELMLLGRQFAELAEITQQNIASGTMSPDSTVALLYFRAQALLGLGERVAAMEILEGLSARHANHRDTAALLHLLKGDRQ